MVRACRATHKERLKAVDQAANPGDDGIDAEDGHLRTMGVAVCWVGVGARSQSRLESLDPCASILSS